MATAVTATVSRGSSDATTLNTETMDELATLAPAYHVMAKGRGGESLTAANQALERIENVPVRSWEEASDDNP